MPHHRRNHDPARSLVCLDHCVYFQLPRRLRCESVLSAGSHPLSTSICADLCFLLSTPLPVVSTAHPNSCLMPSMHLKSPLVHPLTPLGSSKPSKRYLSFPWLPPMSTHVAYSFATLIDKPGFVADCSPARACPSFDMIHGHALTHA